MISHHSSIWAICFLNCFDWFTVFFNSSGICSKPNFRAFIEFFPTFFHILVFFLIGSWSTSFSSKITFVSGSPSQILPVGFNNMYGDHSLSRPPPPMYRRVPPPAHMMTLDRRIPGGAGQGVRGLQHQLLPSGCDVTLNRRHFNNADLRNTNHCSPMQRRLPDDLWLV